MGKKKLLMWGMAVLMVVMAGNGLAQEIIYEDIEITLMENEKEVKKIYVREGSEEESRINQDVMLKIFKKIGIRSEDELYISKKLKARYDEEAKKVIKTKKLEQSKLRFINNKGETVKEIKLAPYGKSRILETFSPVDPKHGSGIGKRYINRSAVVSKDHQYAAVIDDIGESREPYTDKEKDILTKNEMIGVPFGSRGILQYFNNQGVMLWQRQTPERMAITKTVVSTDGNKIIYLQVYTTGNLKPEDEPYEKFYLINKEGSELYSFPKTRDMGYRLGDILAVSDNGRYINIDAYKELKPIKLYFDLINKTLWEAPETYNPYKITDDGVAYLSHPNMKETDPKTFDLRKKLGE